MYNNICLVVTFLILIKIINRNTGNYTHVTIANNPQSIRIIRKKKIKASNKGHEKTHAKKCQICI